jgi:hypothetical protein
MSLDPRGLNLHKETSMIRKVFESVRGTLWAFAVTILVFMVLLAFEIALQGVELHLNLKTYSLLIAVCAGGYFGCRQAKASPWVNWTIFAVVSELLVVSEIRDANTTLIELYPNLDPAAIQWHYETLLVLTIPAALIGALIWVFTSKRAGTRFAVGDAVSQP